MKGILQTPAKYSGPLTPFLARVAPEHRAEEEQRWYRAQMRHWAEHWRRRFEIAALVGKSMLKIGAPPKTMTTLKEDAEWARQVLKRNGK